MIAFKKSPYRNFAPFTSKKKPKIRLLDDGSNDRSEQIFYKRGDHRTKGGTNHHAPHPTSTTLPRKTNSRNPLNIGSSRKSDKSTYATEWHYFKCHTENNIGKLD